MMRRHVSGGTSLYLTARIEAPLYSPLDHVKLRNIFVECVMGCICGDGSNGICMCVYIHTEIGKCPQLVKSNNGG